MNPERSPTSVAPQRFLRVLGWLWLLLVGAIVVSVWLTPHLGRVVDFVLAQTVYRQWTRLVLPSSAGYFDQTLPASTVKSYYSALYRSDVAAMEQLTADALRDQMRQRLASAPPSPDHFTYYSYVWTQGSESQTAWVVEKFHLFWSQGLRFTLQRHPTGWRIIRIEPFP
jgi:hypothetical protein